MTFEIAGVVWTATDAALLISEHESKPPISRAPFMLGCEGCRQLCTIGGPCRCCKDVGTKAGGSGRIVRGIQNEHVRLAISDVLEQLRRPAA